MSQTAQQLITGALRLLGVGAEGETLSAQALNDGLNAFNDMLDSWSIEGLIIPNVVREVFALTAGQSSYTIGQSGTPSFTTIRPMEIEDALIQIGSGTTLLERHMDIINENQYADIRVKQIQTQVPLVLYAENTFPNETINLWPVPSEAMNLVVYSQKAMSSIAALNTVLAFPTGYNRALRFNLAVEYAAEYGKEPSMTVKETALESKTNIQRRNVKDELLKIDDALVSSNKVFDIITGGSR